MLLQDDTSQTQLLTADQMQRLDQSLAALGMDTFELMKNAGRAVAEHILDNENVVSTALIVVGSGNNGGDGYVVAEILRKTGIATTVLGVGSRPIMGSDAEKAQNIYNGKKLSLGNDTASLPEALLSTFDTYDVIVDALFGAGLHSDVTGMAAMIIQAVNQCTAPVVSIDLPSGLSGNDNGIKGVAIQATSTVTFFLAKPAHLLYPGRQLCGKLVIKQIGLDQSHLPSIPHLVHRNSPPLFQAHLPMLDSSSHKYQRGHVLVRSGPISCTGAARLSATTALSCGSGVVSLASSTKALAVNASHLTAVMLAKCDSATEWLTLLTSRSVNVAVVGPGNGLDEQTKDCVMASLQTPVSLVLDADALSCWQDSSADFISALQNACGQVLLTPHAAEFNRVFQHTDIATLPSKLHQATAAAELTQAVIIYKGADTVIAAPDGRAAINCNAPPWLATAGSGDVLAGAVAALHAQGMPLYESALAAVWLHGQSANTLGYPLTAEQLPAQIGRELHDIALLQR